MLHIDSSAIAEVGRQRIDGHWAVQLPCAASLALVAPEDDFSHTNLGWHAELGALVSRPLEDGRLVAVRVGDLTLLVLGEDSAALAERPLAGTSFDSALRWLGRQLGAALETPSHDLPEQPAEFTGGSPTLAGWIGATGELIEGATGAAPRCWPHHFDLASLITLDEAGTDPEQQRSIGVGSSPGDGSSEAPYLYVTPWPYPAEDALPELASPARWHTEGFTAAVLRSTELNPDGAAEVAAAYFEQAIAACRAALDGGGRGE